MPRFQAPYNGADVRILDVMNRCSSDTSHCRETYASEGTWEKSRALPLTAADGVVAGDMHDADDDKNDGMATDKDAQ